jgi:hypothetical protein
MDITVSTIIISGIFIGLLSACIQFISYKFKMSDNTIFNKKSKDDDKDLSEGNK